jgi:hypothetical protein
MTEAEVDDLLSATLHGDLPSATMQRVLVTLAAWRHDRQLLGIPTTQQPPDSRRTEWLATFHVALHGILSGPGSCVDVSAFATTIADRLHGSDIAALLKPPRP